jgi:CheY-like chemotaxis protein
MRILFLDDMQVRHDAAARWFEGHELVPVYTAHAAIEALGGPKFDVVFLDHDLAEEHYLTLSEGLSEERMPGMKEYAPGTGMDVAVFLTNQKRVDAPNLPTLVIVHSWNPHRARQMTHIMVQAGLPAHYIRFNPQLCPVKFS